MSTGMPTEMPAGMPDPALMQFTRTSHHEISPSTEPSKVKLPAPFVVCVFGAGRGIGAGIVESYARAGATALILCGRSTGEMEGVAEEAKKIKPDIKVVVIKTDIAIVSDVAAAASKAKASFDRLDAIIVNSGYAGPMVLDVTQGDPKTFQDVFNVNLIGTYNVAHYFLPLLVETADGAKAFITINSLAAAMTGGPFASTSYCSSKFAQVRLVEMIAAQYEDRGVLAVALHPGSVVTKMSRDSLSEDLLGLLEDKPDLAGGVCVWLTKEKGKMGWLNGRFVSANWDVDELAAKKDEIVEKDLLKFRAAVA